MHGQQNIYIYIYIYIYKEKTSISKEKFSACPDTFLAFISLTATFLSAINKMPLL